MILIVSVSYGEPRYHTPADLGIVVLAAVALVHLLARSHDSRAGGQVPGGHTQPGPSGMPRTTTSTGPA